MDATGERLRSTRQGIETCRPGEHEPPRTEIAVQLGLDGVEDLRDPLVLVDEHGRRSGNERPGLVGYGAPYDGVVEVDHSGTVATGQLGEHGRLPNRAGTLQRDQLSHLEHSLAYFWSSGPLTIRAMAGQQSERPQPPPRATKRSDQEAWFILNKKTGRHRSNRIECDHGRLKARLQPMRGLKRDRTASVVIRGHAFVQNLRRDHYELGVDAINRRLRVAAAFDELARAI